MERTEQFFAHHGGKAIILARFAPIIRTFAPFTAGFGQMNARRFFFFNVTGGVVWVLSFCVGGYFLGQIPWIKGNLKMVFVLIIVVSLIPVVVEFFKHRGAGKESASKGSDEKV
jgi:membrane-associated protein